MTHPNRKVVIWTRLIFITTYLATLYAFPVVFGYWPQSVDGFVGIGFVALATAGGIVYATHRIRPKFIYG